MSAEVTALHQIRYYLLRDLTDTGDRDAAVRLVDLLADELLRGGGGPEP